MPEFAPKRSIWDRLRDWMRHRRRYVQNEPMFFDLVEEGHGVDVGYPRPVFYPSFHDMEWHQIMGQLTSLRLLKGVEFDAFRVLYRCRVGEHEAMTVVQPVQVERSERDAA